MDWMTYRNRFVLASMFSLSIALCPSERVIAQERNGPRDIHACGNAGDISMPLDTNGVPPKIHSLRPFTLLSVDNESSMHFVALAVYKAGDYKIAIISKLGSELIRLESIDRNTATNLFGKSASETQCKYNMISWQKGEPDIFHFELEFNKSGLLSRYKVRGIGITDEKWLSLCAASASASQCKEPADPTSNSRSVCWALLNMRETRIYRGKYGIHTIALRTERDMASIPCAVVTSGSSGNAELNQPSRQRISKVSLSQASKIFGAGVAFAKYHRYTLSYWDQAWHDFSIDLKFTDDRCIAYRLVGKPIRLRGWNKV